MLRLQTGDYRTQVAEEEEQRTSAEDNELATLDQSAHARVTDRCVTLSPSVQDDGNGRTELQVPGSSGPSSSQGFLI